LQYKGIAEVNEDALKQMECAHETFKIEVLWCYVNFDVLVFKIFVLIFSAICFTFPNIIQADKLKKSLEVELLSLRERVSELEYESSLKSEEVASATSGKEEALASAWAEITNLKEENLVKK
jgi:nucleoprotein TPR